MPERLQPYDWRVPTKFEMAFSFGVVCVVTLLGLLILIGVFGISPSFKVTLGIVLVGYGFIRFWMLKARYGKLKRKEQSLSRLPKDDDKSLRNF